ncbi:MAG: hypothetical protein U0893_24990 [Chloroflexota bacterium]
MRGWLVGVAAAAVCPVVLGLAAALGLLRGDAFWIVSPFLGLPLSGVLAGLAVPRYAPHTTALVAALTVPVGLAVGWIVALLVTLPLDPSQDTAQTLFFALLSTFALPWWLGPVLLAMGIAWWMVRRWRGTEYLA